MSNIKKTQLKQFPWPTCTNKLLRAGEYMYDSILWGSVQHICRCGRNDSTNGSLAKNITLNASTKLKQTDSWADIMKISNGRVNVTSQAHRIVVWSGFVFTYKRKMGP